MEDCRFLLGLLIALIGGAVFAGGFRAVLLWHFKFEDDKKRKRIWPWLTGVVERLLFFLLIVATGNAGIEVATAMLAWLALKLGANWNRRKLDTSVVDKNSEVATRTLLALLSGAISLAFAFAGGLVAIASHAH